MVRFIDLFAGIGGFHQAAKELGMACVLASEKDERARKTYLENHHCQMMNEDITTLAPEDVPDHEVLLAGFPCQPFSQAGFKKGFEDERGNLFFYIFKILEEKRPPIAFLENVRALLSHDEGRTYKVIEAALASLGYNVTKRIVWAKDFGVPQARPRLFIIASLKDGYEWPSPVPLSVTLDEIMGGICNRDIAFTLRCGGRGSPIKGRHNWDGYIVGGEEVRLTPAQGAALQGFPSSFVFPVSDSAAMKQLGNSVAVPAIKAHLAAALELLLS